MATSLGDWLVDWKAASKDEQMADPRAPKMVALKGVNLAVYLAAMMDSSLVAK